jgi:type II secretory pathway component GspD/PulD (secretin)
MMRNLKSVLICLALVAPMTVPPPVLAQDSDGQRKVTLVFKSDAHVVLDALARAAHMSIVVPEDLKVIVDVRLYDVPIDDAVAEVASQAGLVFRRIGHTYIVSTPVKMRDTLRTLTHPERVPVVNIDATTAAAQLEKIDPYLTATASGTNIVLYGAPSDLAQARDALRDIDIPQPLQPAVVSVPMTLAYLKATEVVNALKASKTISVADLSGSKLVISGPQADVADAVKMIHTLDTPSGGNTVYRVYKVKYVSPVSLRQSLVTFLSNVNVVIGPDPFHIPRSVINLAVGSSLGQAYNGQQIGASNTGGSSGTQIGQAAASTEQSSQTINRGASARTIMLGGSEENVAAAIDLLDKLDIATPQVQLDVKVVSANPEVIQNLGVQWSQSIGTTVFERPVTNPPNDFPVQLGNDGVLTNGSNFGIGSFGRLPLNFNVQLNAFFQRTDVRVLAKPSITALDDEEGIIFVGETRRVSVSSLVPGVATTSVVLNQVVEIPVGIILQMRPRVTEGDTIQLRVHPIYSSISSTPAAAGLFNTFNREAETSVRIKSGETVVIGGMLQEEDTKTVSKVPFLGDIPIIGNLFRNHSRDHFRREVLVFVTPHLLPD